MRNKLYYTVLGICVLAVAIALFVVCRCSHRQSSRGNAAQVPTTEQSVALVGPVPEETPPVVAETSQPTQIPEKKPESSSSIVAVATGPTEEPVSPQALPQDNQQDQPYLGVASVRHLIPEDGALLAGGWSVPDGSRTFVLVHPRPLTGAHAGQVELSCEFFPISANELTDPAWQTVFAVDHKDMYVNGAVYDANQLSEFRKRYESELNNRTSSPRVVTRYDMPASIKIAGDTHGRMLSVIATRDQLSGNIELRLTAAEYNGIEGLEHE
jgi:hypothetical protein